MGSYLALSGGQVWIEEQGSGPPLLLIHGGAVDGRFFEHNVPALAESFRVVTIDLWGHGRSPDRDGPMTLDSFSTDVAEALGQVVGGRAHVVGHSIGAAVALVFALQHPELVDRLVLVSGGFRADPDGIPDVDAAVDHTAAFLGASYGAVSPDGEAHFPVVIRKDLELSAREPNLTIDDLAGIAARTLVMAADDDLGTLEEQIEMFRSIPDAELAIVPGTSHFLLQEKPAACNAILLSFLADEPVATVAPIRRAPAAGG